MRSTITARVGWFDEQKITFSYLVRRVHRVVAALWVLSFLLTMVASSVGTELPGPSIPGLTFIATILTGSYLLLRPWVLGGGSARARLQRLRNWDVTRSAAIRRTHRLVAAPLLLFIGLALAIEATGGGESELVIIPIIVFLLFLSITGLYMLLRPWVARFRAD